MWDTVTFRYEFHHNPRPEEDDFLSLCDSAKPDPHKGEGNYACSYKSFRIYYRRAGYITFTGSLSKLFYGNNIQVLNTTDTMKAVALLEGHFGLILTACPLYRIDISNVVISRLKPTRYYPYLLKLKNYFRQPDRNSLYYHNGKKYSAVFYDKTAEAKNNNMNIPEQFRNRNLLRYEFRFKKVTKHFGRQVRLSELGDDEFLLYCFNIWKQTYNQIYKATKTIKMDYSKLNSATDWIDLFVKIGASTLDIQVDDLIDEADAQGAFKHPMAKSRAKSRIQKALSRELIEEDPIINEITKKINSVQLSLQD